MTTVEASRTTHGVFVAMLADNGERTATMIGDPVTTGKTRAGGSRVLAVGALVLLVSAALLVPPIGRSTIAESHDARFAVLARDMLERHAWWSAQIGGEIYRNKPPLYPWSIAALSSLRGRVTEATAQAPVVVSALGVVLGTFFLGSRLLGLRVGLWAALVVLTSVGFFTRSQMVLPEMLVAVFATMAVATLWQALHEPRAPGALALFYVALALGVSAKGPVGLVPLVIGGAWLWSVGGVRALRRLWSPVGVALFTVITLVWLAPYLAAGSQSFADRVLWTDWLARYLGGPSPHDLVRLLGEWSVGMMPWELLLPFAVVYAFRAWPDARVRFVLLWFVVFWALILVSHTPRERYLLPAYPAAALLIAWWADTHCRRTTAVTRAAAWLALGGALAAATWPVWLPVSPGRFVPADTVTVVGLSAAAVAVGLVLCLGLRQGRPALLIYGTAAVSWLVLASSIWSYMQWVDRNYEWKRLGAFAAEREVATLLGVELLQVDFYSGRQLRGLADAREMNSYLAGPGRPVALVSSRLWDDMKAERAPSLRVIDRMRSGRDDILLVEDGGEPAAALPDGATHR